MCRYRRSMWLCNHSQLSAEPHALCAVQRDYISGERHEPCYEVNTHTYSTIRIGRLCGRCGTRKASLDKQFSDVKARMATLKQHLDEKYGDCIKHVNEAGLELDDGESTEKVDPVTEFLRMKRNEKYANLMMLGN
ncbi:hypothetical protein F5Y01DRAFT_319755 [Xylaria sp. FL0043]|nr:hypothetical protein F5Y01DRAFT_319755 [Xylaria sp. FL0043]